MAWVRITGAIVAIALHAGVAGGQVMGPTLISPAQGRPVFVAPGGTLQIVAVVPEEHAAGPFELAIVSDRFPSHRHTLELPPDAGQRLLRGEPQALALPEGVPMQTYNLMLRAGGIEAVARHSVAVGSFDEPLRLVHLSDMSIGDVAAPAFDQRLIDEINLAAPALIVATGDYFDATAGQSPTDWDKLSQFFARFEAPVLMACGDHDDIAQYSRVASPSAIGSVEIGPWRGLVLLDHARHPANQDAQQMSWAEHQLADAARPTFIVGHHEPPGLMRHWLSQGALTQQVQRGRIAAWFAGGHTDWDGRVLRRWAEAAAPALYVRTHQSSPAAVEGAEGVSHYRIVDLDNGRATLLHQPADAALRGAPPSTPVGRLGVTFEGPNDGSAEQVIFTAVNNLPHRLDRLSVRVLVKRSGSAAPWCIGAEMGQVVSFGRLWECRVHFDLPDKGARRIVVGVGPMPAAEDVRVDFDAPSTLRFASKRTADGVEYQSCLDQPMVFVSRAGRPEATAVQPVREGQPGAAAVQPVREGQPGAAAAQPEAAAVQPEAAAVQPVEIMPRVRLDGSPIAYRPVDREGPFALAYRIQLTPGAIVPLELDLSAVRVNPGLRELQVYLSHGPATWPISRAVSILVQDDPAVQTASAEPSP